MDKKALFVLLSIILFWFTQSSAQLPETYDLRDLDLVTRVQSQKKGTCWCHGTMSGIEGNLLVTGNWEAAGAYLAAAGLPMAAVVKQQRNPAFNERMLETRRRSGVEPIYMQDAYTRIPEALREGKTVALVADQDAGKRGVFVPFLGREASTFKGPARLALSQDVPLFFGAAVRLGPDYGWVLDRVEKPPAGKGAVLEYTRRWVSRLEAQVRLHPEQYFWFHRRWKTRPPGTTAGV